MCHQDRQQRRQRFHVTLRHHGQHRSRDCSAQQDRRRTLDYIEHERCQTEALALGAQYVGRADVAAAHGTDILAPEDEHQQIAHRDRPKQVSCRRDPDKCKEHTA